MATTSIYDASVFKKYFEINDADLLIWVENVLNKLKGDGILAKFIDKGDTDDSDADFQALEEPIVIFFGYLVRLAREFEGFKNDDTLANNYLLNTGQFTCGDETLNQFLYSITNLLRKRAKRGTIETITPAANSDRANGEILDLVCWSEYVFFKLGVPRPQHNSWNINNSSPLYRGCTGRYDLNLGYENTEDVIDLNVYPLLNSQYIKKTEYRGKNCIEIEAPYGVDSGIGLTDMSKKIIVNPNYNFEITFNVSQDITLENLTFGVKMFNELDEEISPLSAVHGGPKTFFFQTRRLNKAGKFYFVRGIIFNKDQPNMSVFNSKLNIGFGENLKFPEECVSIIPYLVMDNDLGNDSDSDNDNFADSDSIDIFQESDSDSTTAASDYFDGTASVYIHNFKVTPCSTDYERCYLNNKNFIDVIATNKNGEYNKDQIKDILRKYFIPYNTAFGFVNLPRTIPLSGEIYNLLLETSADLLFEDDGLIILEEP